MTPLRPLRAVARLCLVLLMLFVVSTAAAQTADTTLRLIFAGDLMGHVPIHDGARLKDGSYDYCYSFRYVKDYIRSADIAIANLEVALGGKPYTGYPCFSAPDAFAAAAREAGFDIFTTANNHCLDRGRRGLERTIDVLDSLQILHLGTYKNVRDRAEQHPLIVDRQGIRLALLCYTYGTNGIKVRQPNVVNLIDTTIIRRDLLEARRQKADFVIVLVHWGVEYQHRHNSDQQSLAQWLFDNGCHAVIGSHPHVVQDIVTGHTQSLSPYNRLVVYSLGNFISNQRSKTGTDGGIMVELELRKSGGRTSIYHAAYLPFWVNRTLVDGRRQFVLVPSADALECPEYYGLNSVSLQSLRRFHHHVTEVVKSAPPKGETVADAPFSIPQTRFYYDGQPSQPLLFTYRIVTRNNDFPRCPDTSYCHVYTFNRKAAATRIDASPRVMLRPYRYLDFGDRRLLLPAAREGLLAVSDKSARASRSEDLWHLVGRDDSTAHYRYHDALDGDSIDVYIRLSDIETNPLPDLPRFPGIVDSASYFNGAVRCNLIKIEKASHSRTPIATSH